MPYYVYELVDPRDDSVFYVGKGVRGRINEHEREAGKGVVSAKCDRIRDIQSQGLAVGKRKVSHFVDEQDAFDAEAQLIKSYGLNNLTNVAPGGGTARGGPTIYDDRLQVSATAEMLCRTRGGAIRKVLLIGQELDLSAIIDASISKCVEIIDRRGAEWANEIAARYRVRFSHASA